MPVVALSQLSEQLKCVKKRPNLADLRESGSLNKMRCHMSVYREEYYLDKREPERKRDGIRGNI